MTQIPNTKIQVLNSNLVSLIHWYLLIGIYLLFGIGDLVLLGNQNI
jgi:hypothetical protein